jgi:hypothetical protein
MAGLKKELQQVKKERDSLKEAAYFARESRWDTTWFSVVARTSRYQWCVERLRFRAVDIMNGALGRPAPDHKVMHDYYEKSVACMTRVIMCLAVLESGKTFATMARLAA